MARNEEKHYGKLNRLYLLKEKEEYEKANPKRPRLDTLNTPEEIREWLPSIKRDINFYINKSKVTCYSEAHVEECREKVSKLEKEFKAFIRKFKQLTKCPSEPIPWTSRPYKRKSSETSEGSSSKEFKRIATPILEKEPKGGQKTVVSSHSDINWTLMDEPLNFSMKSEEVKLDSSEHSFKENKTNSEHLPVSCSGDRSNLDNKVHNFTSKGKDQSKNLNNLYNLDDKENKLEKIANLVNYDSSDSESA